ncbi:MAG: arylsulfatase [Planctomycetes bacterium]|nr:arylsulfatase [Planctomycetota bacterium]
MMILLLLCIGLSCLASVQADTRRPNVVVFLADDQGWGDLSIHGNTNLSTPNIDTLARDGALFESFYVCRVCAPTRAELLTGRYYPRTGVRGVSTGQERLNADEITLAQTFKRAGYTTGAFGKWHNGSQGPYHPNARGFDEYYGFTSGHWGNYFDPMLEHNGTIVRGKGYITDDLTNKAMAFIEENRDKPFLCYVPYNTPHSPMQVPDEFFEKVANRPLLMHNRNPRLEDMPHLRAALAMCENIDWNVGRVLKKLDALNLTDNTIVIYFSDNGPNGWRWNGGMKGRKGSIDEGGVRVPFMIRWPGKIKPGLRVEEIADAVDLLPTLADCADVPLISKKKIDGKSLTPLLLGGQQAWPDRFLFHYGGRVKKGAKGPPLSVRSQRFRLDAAGQLFDMKADRGQNHDVAKTHPEVVASMQLAARQFMAELDGVIGPDTRPFPVGFSPSTLLPARDGKTTGKIQRSGRAPNCSYFKNWVQKEDKIFWDVEITQTGEYDVLVYYTCPKADLGATFELSCNGATLRGRVTQANDPPLRGAENDRTPNRGSESYVKTFKPMHVGTVRLKKGRGELALRATDIPGTQVMEVRLLNLIRK